MHRAVQCAQLSGSHCHNIATTPMTSKNMTALKTQGMRTLQLLRPGQGFDVDYHRCLVKEPRSAGSKHKRRGEPLVNCLSMVEGKPLVQYLLIRNPISSNINRPCQEVTEHGLSTRSVRCCTAHRFPARHSDRGTNHADTTPQSVRVELLGPDWRTPEDR